MAARALVLVAFLLLPYSVPCWIVGSFIYLIRYRKEDSSGDTALSLVLAAPITLPYLAYGWAKGKFASQR